MTNEKPRSRVIFACPESLGARVRRYSEQTGLGMSEIIRAALVEYLDRRSEDRPPACCAFHSRGGNLNRECRNEKEETK